MAQIGNLGSLRVGVELPIKGWNKNYGKITADVKKYPKTTDKALGRAGKAWEKHAKTVKAASIGMVAFGTAATVAFGLAVNEAATFQQSMVNTQAVVGATSEELAELTGFAREMGKATVFSATESATAMNRLGSAGLSTKEIMDSLKGTLDLAAATNADLAFTAQTVASTLSQYGLAAEESGRISNVFAATISASQATMDKLSTSMSIVGPVAKAVGLSLEETAGILGSLFNAGLDASTAGTSLRQSMAQLLKPTDDAKEALGRLNVETLDSQGKLRNLTDIIADLEVSGLSAADAMAIFGVRAGPGMLALVSQGADSIRDLTAAVTDTDKAAEIAALQIGTFQGQTKLLQSALSELKIEIGNQLLPVLTDYTTKLTGIINRTSDWTAANPKLTKTLVALGAALGLVVGGVGGLGLAAGPVIKGVKILRRGLFLLGNTVPVLTVRLALMGKTIAGIGAGGLAAGAAAGIGVFGAALHLFKGQIDDTRESLIGFDSVTKAQRGNIARIQEGIDEWKRGLQTLQTALDSGTTHVQRLDKATGEWIDIPVTLKMQEATRAILSLNRALRIEKGDILGVTQSLEGNIEKLFSADNILKAVTTSVNAFNNPMATLNSLFATLVERLGSASGELITFKSLLELPDDAGIGTIQLQRNADAAVAILKQRTAFEKDWITVNGIIQLGLVEKNVEERLNLIGDETKQEARIRLKAQKEERKAREEGLAGALFIPETEAKKINLKLVGIGKDRAHAIADLESKLHGDGKKQAFKDSRDIADDKLRTGAAVNDRIAANDKKARAESLASAKQNMSAWADNWDKTITEVERDLSGFFEILISPPGHKSRWEEIANLYRDFWVTAFSDILASSAVNRFEKFITGQTAGTSIQIPGGGQAGGQGGAIPGTGGGGTGLTAGDANLFIKAGKTAFSIGTSIGRTQFAADHPILSQLGSGAFGLLGSIGHFFGRRSSEKTKDTGTVRNIRANLPDDARAALASRRRKQSRVRQTFTDDVSATPTGDTFQPFVPRRPEGTDRFGRPLAATTAMAPAAPGVRGDVNIEINVVVQGQDIRDMDIAEWQRIFRENLEPAAEAEGKRFVRSDNVMA